MANIWVNFCLQRMAASKNIGLCKSLKGVTFLSYPVQYGYKVEREQLFCVLTVTYSKLQCTAITIQK